MKRFAVLLALAFLTVDIYGQCGHSRTFHFPFSKKPIYIITCTHLTLENFEREVSLYLNRDIGFKLIHVHLESFPLSNYDNVKFIYIDINTLEIHESAFSKFQNLRNLTIKRCKFSSSIFKGFDLDHGISFLEDLTISKIGISYLGAICSRHPNLISLSINENTVTEIKTEILYGCSKMKYLDLSENLITKIEPNSFQDLELPTYFSLRSNKLFNITRNSFNGSRTYELDLSYNGISFLESGAFNGINANKLSLRFNKITDLSGDPFNRTVSLKVLDLSYNQLRIIDPISLIGLDNLQSIYLRGNNFTKITRNAFVGLSKITEIDLSMMNLTVLESGAFNGLIQLEYLDLSYNNLTELLVETFNETTQLKKLYLSNNSIYSIGPKAFVALSNLRYLNLTCNNLSIITANSFVGLSKLETLQLSSNDIETLENGAFNGLLNLQKLDLEGGKLKILSTEIFNQTKNLKILDLTNNQISKLEIGSLDGLDNLEVLNLYRNKLKNINCEATRYPFKKIQSLNMSYNEIIKIDICAFKHFSNLFSLDLSHNKISKIPRATFSTLNALQTLNLSNNQLTQIDSSFLSSQASLKILDLSSNHLVNWDVHPDISHINSSGFVYLANNKWDCDSLTIILKALCNKSIKHNKTIQCIKRASCNIELDSQNGTSTYNKKLNIVLILICFCLSIFCGVILFSKRNRKRDAVTPPRSTGTALEELNTEN